MVKRDGLKFLTWGMRHILKDDMQKRSSVISMVVSINYNAHQLARSDGQLSLLVGIAVIIFVIF